MESSNIKKCYFVVGDIHGCLYTLKTLLTAYWQPDEVLVLIGDLIDRGAYSYETIQYVISLEKRFINQVVVLRGNHEQELIEHLTHGPNTNWLMQGGDQTLSQYEAHHADPREHLKWLNDLPLYYETDKLFISHAGIALLGGNPYETDNPFGILWNRSPLKNMNKLQVIGHTPRLDGPVWNQESHSINIDTGAAYGGSLTGIKISKGTVLEQYSVPVDGRDRMNSVS